MKFTVLLVLSLWALPMVGGAAKLFSFAQIGSLMQVSPKPLAIFLHAPWCRYCKNMELNTFTNPSVRSLLDSAFYFVSLNGESQASVTFRGHTFPYTVDGRDMGVHSLAIGLVAVEGGGVLPTFVVLNPKYEIIFHHVGFLGATQMEDVLKSLERFRRQGKL